MKELNELVGLAVAYENAETRKEAFEIVERFNDSCGFKSIIEIDKAFRELEKRAEAAEAENSYMGGGARYWHDEYCAQQHRLVAKVVATEAKLAELEKQEPVGKQYRVSAKGNNSATGWSLWHDGDGEQYRNSYDVQVRNVFTRPAPAVNLAELVPEEITSALSEKMIDICDGFEVGDSGAKEIWKACRANIMRNIEESK